MAYEKDGKILYEVGDEIDFEFQTFPGPRNHSVKAKVIKCYTESFYQLEYEFQGEKKRKDIIRSYLR